MHVKTLIHPFNSTIRDEGGFTLLMTIAILFVSSLLVAGALANASGDVHLTRSNTGAQNAYYAAQAGLQVYEYNLNSSLEYWKTCPHSEGENEKKEKSPSTPVKLLEESSQTYNGESYKFETLPTTGNAKCEENKQASIVETTGTANDTFRIKATGYANGVEKSIIATFKHPGFLNYVFLSNYEVEDPTTFKKPPVNCEHYYKAREEKGYLAECPPIPFIGGDELNGPFHSNDRVSLCSVGGEAVFGREGHSPEDTIEMNEGIYADKELNPFCGASYTIYGKKKEKVPTLTPPPTDTELLETAEDKFIGRTRIELKGSEMTVWNAEIAGGKETIPFPKNGVVFVSNKSSPACGVTYSPFSFDEDYEKDTNCGDVYVKGSYTESLTIASQQDVIVDGNIYTTGGESGGQPTGGATLGLVAEDFVRVYHPVAATGEKKNERTKNIEGQCEGKNQKAGEGGVTNELGGVNENLIIDAAILSTKNSFIVDNFFCGNSLGKLTVWGAIAQFWRGRVTKGPGEAGYPVKNYNYDERLVTKQPPNFLSPNSSGGWELERETAPS